MTQYLAQITLLVDDYDEAIDFYIKKLGFVLLEDTSMEGTKRWVRIMPKGAKECSILLAKAANDEQTMRIGTQTGGRVSFFLHTDDFQSDYQNLLDNKVRITRGPSSEIYGTVAVFADLYGNLWDLVEPKAIHNK